MGVPQITPAELLQLMQSGEPLLIVDVRDAESFAQGHITGSRSNPAQTFDIGMFKDLPADTHIVISCYRGMMSKDVVKYLDSNGIANASSLKGGMDGWRRLAGAPIER